MFTPIDINAGFWIAKDGEITALWWGGKEYRLPEPMAVKRGDRYRWVMAASGECPVALEAVPEASPKFLLV